LEIGFADILGLIGSTFLVSFVLGSVPGMGAFVSVSLLCTLYGKDLQESYLVLKPIASLLVCFSVLLDVVTSAFVSFLITHGKRVNYKTEMRNFI